MSVKDEAEFWTNELRDLSPDILYLIWEQLGNKLEPGKYERLGTVEEYDEDDEETYTYFICPHCQSKLAYHELVIVDWSRRESEFDDQDEGSMTLHAYYGSTEDYNGIAYECGDCGSPVSLPAGWKETS